MTTVCIHQPDFAPYLGFFDRLLDTDIFILLDDAQFIHDGWTHRDRIKTPRGEVWVTLPIDRNDKFKPIRDIRLATPAEVWQKKVVNLLSENYRKAEHFKPIITELADTFQAHAVNLVDLNLAVLDMAYRIFDLSPVTRFASEFSLSTTRNQRLIDLVKAVGGTKYLSGTGALSYLDFDLFKQNGIEVVVQDFKHPSYPQLHGDFAPYLSCLDVFFNCGADSARVLRSCRA
jgi:hypothetical protein